MRKTDLEIMQIKVKKDNMELFEQLKTRMKKIYQELVVFYKASYIE